MIRSLLVVLAAACGMPRTAPVPLDPPVATSKKAALPWSPGHTFDRVAFRLQASLYDTAFRRAQLPGLIDKFRADALQSTTPAQERAIIWSLLAQIPATHLGLLSRSAYVGLINEIDTTPQTMFGLQLVRIGDRYFATTVLTGGPADSAGIRAWDEIVAVDARPTGESPRLDWRSDDAYLGDDQDPPTYGIPAAVKDSVRLTVAEQPGRTRDVLIKARSYSAYRAAARSIRQFERDLVRIGYVHWWYMHDRGLPSMLTKALEGPLEDCDALVLDLRGRGGSGKSASALIASLSRDPARRFDGAVVALIDRQTRSAKEMVAADLRAEGLGRLVGEPTAGAVVSAGFDEVGDGAILMFPESPVAQYTERLELKPTVPDVAVPWGGPYSGTRDPILEAGLDEAARLVHLKMSSRH
jgi:tricorn protease